MQRYEFCSFAANFNPHKRPVLSSVQRKHFTYRCQKSMQIRVLVLSVFCCSLELQRSELYVFGSEGFLVLAKFKCLVLNEAKGGRKLIY